MNISKDKVISLTYRLRNVGSEEIIEVVDNNKPLTFIYGKGSLLPGFEKAIEGLKTGNAFSFTLQSENAYGPVSDEAIMELPTSIFQADGQSADELLTIGNVIPMRDQQGRRFDGKVIAVTNDMVKMDFNHPMAGKDLYFEGEVMDIREATEDELNDGLESQGCSGCGGSCGEGGGSCNSDDCEDDNCGSGSCGCN